VLAHDLLQGSFVLALEHILKLHKGVREVKIDLLGPFFEVGDCFIDRELNAKVSTILVDFGLDFATRIIALQLVSLGQLGLLVSCLFCDKVKWFLINRGHGTDSSTHSLIPDMVVSCFLCLSMLLARYSCFSSALPCQSKGAQ
jgi:hypothetical protein